MGAVKKKLVAPLVLFAVFACSAQSPAPAGPTPTGPDTLCSQFCGQQQSRGSLVGPLQDCIDQCCDLGCFILHIFCIGITATP